MWKEEFIKRPGSMPYDENRGHISIVYSINGKPAIEIRETTSNPLSGITTKFFGWVFKNNEHHSVCCLTDNDLEVLKLKCLISAKQDGGWDIKEIVV